MPCATISFALIYKRIAAVLGADLHDFAGFVGGGDHFSALLDGVGERLLLT